MFKTLQKHKIQNHKTEAQMQIDFVQFLTQAAGLVAWVFAAAAIYAVIEKAVGGPAPHGEQ